MTLSIEDVDFLSFFFAATGFLKAKERLEANPANPHSAIETAYWIGAAAEATDRHTAGDVLSGFYWVRNKGAHETLTVVDQYNVPRAVVASLEELDDVPEDEPFAVIPTGDEDAEFLEAINVTVPTWGKLSEVDPNDSRAVAYAKHLAGKPVLETVNEAAEILRAMMVTFLTEIATHEDDDWPMPSPNERSEA